MKVQVFNAEGRFVKSMQNVTNVKNCLDGRKLITTERMCECCKQTSRLIDQIPVNYNIKIFFEALDEISVVSIGGRNED